MKSAEAIVLAGYELWPDSGRGVASGAITYFLQAESGGPIKIGRSTRAGLPARIKCIQCGNPRLLVARFVALGDWEGILHKAFSDYRLSGEWFRALPDLADRIGALGESESIDSAALNSEYQRGYHSGYQLATETLAATLPDKIAAALRSELEFAAEDAEIDAYRGPLGSTDETNSLSFGAPREQRSA